MRKGAPYVRASSDLTPKPPSASSVTLVQLMELADANLLGNVHGGVVMKMVDTAAGLSALKHCGGPAVTVALDEMSFLEPVMVGDVVTVRAMVNGTGRTSMEIGVRVEAEDTRTGSVVHTSSAYLVFVALDDEGKPRVVRPVEPETPVERRRQAEAELRREARLARAGEIRRHRHGRDEG